METRGRQLDGERQAVEAPAQPRDQGSAFVVQGESRLDGTRDRDELCRLVRERYAVPAESDVGRDVDAFLGELSRRGLVAA